MSAALTRTAYDLYRSPSRSDTYVAGVLVVVVLGIFYYRVRQVRRRQS